MPGGAEEIIKVLGQAPLDLAPANFREWMQFFHHSLNTTDAQIKVLQEAGSKLTSVVDKLSASRQSEIASCPFNQDNPSYEDGHKVIDRLGLLEDNVGKLSEVVGKLTDVEIKIAKLEGAGGLLKWVGVPALAALFGLAIKGAFFS